MWFNDFDYSVFKVFRLVITSSIAVTRPNDLRYIACLVDENRQQQPMNPFLTMPSANTEVLGYCKECGAITALPKRIKNMFEVNKHTKKPELMLCGECSKCSEKTA